MNYCIRKMSTLPLGTIDSMLIPCEQLPSIKKINAIPGISYQLRYTYYTPYKTCAGMFLHKNFKKSQLRNWWHLYCRLFFFHLNLTNILSISKYKSKYETDLMVMAVSFFSMWRIMTASFLLSLNSKCMTWASRKYSNKLARRGAQLVRKNCRLIVKIHIL